MGEEEGWVVVVGVAVSVVDVIVVVIIIIVVAGVGVVGALGRRGDWVSRNHVLSGRIISWLVGKREM